MMMMRHVGQSTGGHCYRSVVTTLDSGGGQGVAGPHVRQLGRQRGPAPRTGHRQDGGGPLERRVYIEVLCPRRGATRIC